jgi:hypothetical protein
VVVEFVVDELEDVVVDEDVVVVVTTISGVKEYRCPASGLTFITRVFLLNHIFIFVSEGSLHLKGILGYFL